MDRGHYPQLDGLRALAVSAVFAGHFLSDTWLAKAVGWGDAGVILFFCLSGYLITDILLEIDAPSAADRRAGVGIFYVRRVLRIFPIYYFTLGIAVLVDYRPVVENLGRLVTYSLNIPMLPPTDNLGAASHFWSLSVEEQFYLLWPAAVVFFPRRHLRSLVLAVVGVSLVHKFGFAAAGGPYQLVFWNVLGCMDSLGLGALLAVRRRENGTRPEMVRGFLFAGAIAALVWLALTAFRIATKIDPLVRGTSHLWRGTFCDRGGRRHGPGCLRSDRDEGVFRSVAGKPRDGPDREDQLWTLRLSPLHTVRPALAGGASVHSALVALGGGRTGDRIKFRSGNRFMARA